MKFSRTVCTSLIALTLPAFAFQRSSSSAFLGQTVMRPRSTTAPSYSTTTAPTMLLGKLFGGGGAFEADRVVYSNLDHPGPELGKWAEQGLMPATSERDPQLALATFAGGCFWGLELAYQRVPGVQYTAVGYAQGPELNPTYNQVCAGATGHTEAIMVYYNPNECEYSNLLDTFFERVDPTTVNGQGRDYGKQYRTGIYFHTAEQEVTARARMTEEAKKFKKPVATELKAATPFWPAEKYHQQYLAKGGRFGTPQSATKGATDTIRCYG